MRKKNVLDLASLTIMTHWMRSIVDNLSWTVDGETGPFLHRSTIDVFLRMLDSEKESQSIVLWYIHKHNTYISHLHQKSSRKLARLLE